MVQLLSDSVQDLEAVEQQAGTKAGPGWDAIFKGRWGRWATRISRILVVALLGVLDDCRLKETGVTRFPILRFYHPKVGIGPTIHSIHSCDWMPVMAGGTAIRH